MLNRTGTLLRYVFEAAACMLHAPDVAATRDVPDCSLQLSFIGSMTLRHVSGAQTVDNDQRFLRF